MNTKNKKPMTVYVDQSPVGIGKTYNALSHAVQYPARYLFATERRESVLEIEERARSMAYDRRAAMTIKTIVSSLENRGSSVATDIAALPSMFENDANHALIIITHAALMATDLSGFEGWHVIIDEVPGILVQQTFQTKTDRAFFERNYRLDDINGQWSRVSLTEAGEALTSADLSHCQSHDYLRAFHQRVSSGLRPVVCNLQDWESMELNGTEWTWWSMFDVRQLQAFETIKFLGSNFMTKLAAKMLQNFDPDVIWVADSRVGVRQPQRKRVNVHYFTDHIASRYYFESAHGQEHLKTIAKYLTRTMPLKSIWSANDPLRELTAAKAMRPHMASRYLTPKQAGTSEFQADYHDAAIIYSSKPSKANKAILETLGCTEADWVETNEYETILQFLTRTSVRDVTTGGTTNLYVLSRDQADYLVSFFEAQPHIEVELHHVDLDLVYPPSQRRGPKVKVLTPTEAAAKAEAIKATKAQAARDRRAREKAIKLGGVK